MKKAPSYDQNKIANIPSTVERVIEAKKRIIQTTTELTKALFHKLFTEGLRNEPRKQTEIDPVPESWELVDKFYERSDNDILMSPGHFHLGIDMLNPSQFSI